MIDQKKGRNTTGQFNLPFPMKTGMRFFMMTSLRVKEIPVRRAAGMMNKLAIECSNPMATKVEMGNQHPTSFPARSLDAPDRKTARLTIQLQRMAFMTVCPKVAPHLPMAVLVTRSATPPVKRPEY